MVSPDNKPELREAFKELLPVASQWKTIGVLLGLPEHVLDQIKSDEEGVNNQLQKMISRWLKQTDSSPSWKDLADAVESVDKRKAEKIQNHCLHT